MLRRRSDRRVADRNESSIRDLGVDMDDGKRRFGGQFFRAGLRLTRHCSSAIKRTHSIEGGLMACASIGASTLLT